MKEMRAFHKDPAIKAKYVARVKAHEEADRIIKGSYWENGKGCAVGCTIEGSEHKRYEIELGIPETIAYTEDFLFERMENGDSMIFPRRFLEATPVGADLSLVPAKLIVFILKDVMEVKETREDKNVYKAVKKVVELWQKVVDGKVVKGAAWSAAWSAARSAAFKRYADYLLKLLREAPIA